MRVAYFVSPIGLGHASRSVAIAKELSRKGFKIKFFTGGPAVHFLSSYGFEVKEIYKSIPNFYVSKDGKLKYVTIWMIKYITFYKRAKKIVEKELLREKFDAVIADEDFAAGVNALANKLPLAFITDLVQTNFSKNWLARKVEERTNAWFRKFFEECPLTIVPEENGVVIGNMIYVGPIARKIERSKEEILADIGMEKDFILVSGSGAPIRNFLLEPVIKAVESKKLGLRIIYVGKKPIVKHRIVKHLEFYRDLHELIALSKVVVTTAGKTTIDECLIYGTPCIAIPIKGHFEQERNAKKLGFKYEDIYQIETILLKKLYGEKKTSKAKNNLEKAVKIIEKNLAS